MGLRDCGDEEDERSTETGVLRHFKEFDCPQCDANNPCNDGFESGDEVHCNYCGLSFRVELLESGRLRFREV